MKRDCGIYLMLCHYFEKKVISAKNFKSKRKNLQPWDFGYFPAFYPFVSIQNYPKQILLKL